MNWQTEVQVTAMLLATRKSSATSEIREVYTWEGSRQSPAIDVERWRPKSKVQSLEEVCTSGSNQAAAKNQLKLLRTAPSTSGWCFALGKFELDVRTSIDDIDQRPPRCPRKSSRSPALPSASTRATYVHPEKHHRPRTEKDEGGPR